MTEEDYEINDYDNDEDNILDYDDYENKDDNQDMLNYDEIMKNTKNIKKKTVPFLNKFEKARLIGVRIQQLSSGAQPKINNVNLNSIKEIVEEELKQRKIPLMIKRNLPNGEYEIWKLEEFEKV